MTKWSKFFKESDQLYRSVFLITQIATVAVFLGRAWQHLRWDAPYRALLWDEKWMKGIIEGIFQTDWQVYITSSSVDRAIQNVIQGTGWFYLLCALCAALINRWTRLSRIVLTLGGVSLIILALLYFKEKFFFAGQLFEYSLQFGAPFLLISLSKVSEIRKPLVRTMKWLVALTFSCHGLFAIGAYPRPGYFVEMTANILGVNEQIAVQFLIVAGVLDFVLSVLIFFPGRLSFYALIYATFWGFVTSMARIVAYFHWDFWVDSLSLWAHETIYRFPHFLIPFALILIYLHIAGEKESNP